MTDSPASNESVHSLLMTLAEAKPKTEAEKRAGVALVYVNVAAVAALVREQIELLRAARAAVETADGLPLSQEPKYNVRSGRLVNRATGVPIPDDEPVFILRAKDRHACVAIQQYRELCEDAEHRAVVQSRVDDFLRFALLRLAGLKEPDTSPPQTTRDEP